MVKDFTKNSNHLSKIITDFVTKILYVVLRDKNENVYKKEPFLYLIKLTSMIF